MENKGLLNKKLKTYYADVNLKNYRKNLLEAMERYTGEKFEKILDIGSGVGSFAESVKPFGYKVFGLEGSDYGVKQCKSKGVDCQKFLLEKGNKLPFKENEISLVVMNQVIEHIDKETGQYYIKEIMRVLQPGGVGIIKSPSRYSKIWKTDPHHVYCWKPNELYREVSQYIKSSANIKLYRTPLEFWMLRNYNEEVIDTWHKYNKYPKIKRVFYIIVKVMDKLISKISNTDKLLANADIIFVKDFDSEKK